MKQKEDVGSSQKLRRWMVTRETFHATVLQMIGLDWNERSETLRKDLVLLQHDLIRIKQQKTMQKGL